MMKKWIKVIVMFAVGLTIGKLIQKCVCKKRTYNVIQLSDCTDMIEQ